VQEGLIPNGVRELGERWSLLVAFIAGVCVSGSPIDVVGAAGSAVAALSLLLIATRHLCAVDRDRAFAMVTMAVSLLVSEWVPIALLLGALGAVYFCRSAFVSRQTVTVWAMACTIAFAVLAWAGSTWWAVQRDGLTWYRMDGWHFGATLPAVFIVAALVNAVFEEHLWRWLLPGLAIRGSIPLLAFGFGAAHWNSIPSGWLGVLLATAFAFGMHLLTRLSRNTIALAVAVHVVADITLLWAVFGRDAT
jgi:hypothetical protein